MNIVRIAFVILVSGLAMTACARSDREMADALVTRVKQRNVRDALVRWVRDNVETSKITAADIDDGGEALPGRHRLNKAFDWSLLGLPSTPGSQVRLLYDGSNKIVAVYFGTSRYGVVVAIEKQFGIDDASLLYTDSRFAVYYPRD